MTALSHDRSTRLTAVSGVRSREEVQSPPSLLIRRVRLGSGGPTVDVRTSGGAIAQIGDLTPGTRESTIDGTGATLLPGFVDGHLHMVQWATSRSHIDVGAARSARHAVQLLVAAVSDRAERTTVLVAYGFRDGLWTEPPHKDLLEAALPGRALAIMSQDLHAMWLSPAGLAQIGVDHPTGVLREQECMAARFAIGALESAGVVDGWVVDATRALARVGITEVIDYEFADNATDWVRRTASGQVAVRVRASVWQPWLDESIERGLRTGDPVADTRGLVEVGPFKLISDGSLNTRTAYCYEPYPDAPSPQDAYGLQLIAPDELAALMAKGDRHGLRPAVHAIGDHANAVALAAFEQVGCAGRIEHAQLVRAQDAHRFARPGLVTSVQPQHATADRDVADHHWHGRTAQAFPYAALLAAGARLELGSDAPVAEPNPWHAVTAAVARTDDDRPPWHPEQAIPLQAALAAASAGRTAIRPGARADLVLAAADPADLGLADLRDIPVLATVLGGLVTYRSDDDTRG